METTLNVAEKVILNNAIVFDENRSYSKQRFSAALPTQSSFSAEYRKQMFRFSNAVIKPAVLVTGTVTALVVGSAVAFNSAIASSPGLITEASDTLMAFLGTIW